MRVLGLDHGQARIGVALSDPTGTIASPHSVIVRKRRRKQDLRDIAALARALEAERIVVGVPYELDGAAGKKAREVEQFAEALRAVADVPVDMWDERLTTVQADQALREAGLRRRDRAEVVDKVAAALILQAYLDARGWERQP